MSEFGIDLAASGPAGEAQLEIQATLGTSDGSTSPSTASWTTVATVEPAPSDFFTIYYFRHHTAFVPRRNFYRCRRVLLGRAPSTWLGVIDAIPTILD